MALGPNWFWGCCCITGSSTSGAGNCPCCLDVAEMPAQMEVVISGIVNNKCLNCTNYNGTYVLDLLGGCCYELIFPNECPSFDFTPDKLEVCFEVIYRLPPALPECGIFVRLTTQLAEEESVSWATLSEDGKINGCCVYSGESLALHEIFTPPIPPPPQPSAFPSCIWTSSTAVVSAICL